MLPFTPGTRIHLISAGLTGTGWGTVGWGTGASSLQAALRIPPEIPALGGRRCGLQGFGVSVAWVRGSGVDKARSGPGQPAPPLLALGETTENGGGCRIRDAGAAANGCAGRWAGTMATANCGPGRGPAVAVGHQASALAWGT